MKPGEAMRILHEALVPCFQQGVSWRGMCSVVWRRKLLVAVSSRCKSRAHDPLHPTTALAYLTRGIPLFWCPLRSLNSASAPLKSSPTPRQNAEHCLYAAINKAESANHNQEMAKALFIITAICKDTCETSKKKIPISLFLTPALSICSTSRH